MTNRVLIDKDSFKVSKPGVNVLTALPHQLLINGTDSSAMALQNGNYTIPPDVFNQDGTLINSNQIRPFLGSIVINGTFVPSRSINDYLFTFPSPQFITLNNNTNAAPLPLCQRRDLSLANTSWGGGFYFNKSVGGYYFGIFGGSSVSVSRNINLPSSVKGYNGRFHIKGNNQLLLSSFDIGDQYYYSTFYIALGTSASSGTSSSINNLGFTNGYTNNQGLGSNIVTVSGATPGTPITLSFTLSSTITSGRTYEISVDGNITSIAQGASTVQVTVFEGSAITVYASSTTSHTFTSTVRNVSDSNVIVSNFTLEVDLIASGINFGTASGGGYGETSNVQLSGLSGSTVTLNVSGITGSNAIMIYVNNVLLGPFRSTSSINFNASNGDMVRFGVYARYGINEVITITNNGNNIGTVTATVSASNNVPSNILTFGNVAVFNISQTFVSGDTATQAPNDIANTRTFKISITGNSTGFNDNLSTTVFVNNNGVASSSNDNTVLSFTVNNTNNISFRFFMSGTNLLYSGTARVFIVVNGIDVILNTFTIYLETGDDGGFGGGEFDVLP